jgi:hypothetical protein
MEARERATRTDVRSPEAANHDYPLELVFKLGARLFALEHTGIEPFDDHMRLEAEAKRLRRDQNAVTGLLHSDILEIHVPAKAMLGRKKDEVRRIQTAIIAWCARQLRRSELAATPTMSATFNGHQSRMFRSS